MPMLTTSLFGLLLVFLLPIGLLTVILGCIRKWRENTYAAFFTYGVSNWITFVLLLLFFFPKLGLSLSDVGLKSIITLKEISLALLFTLVGIGWFALMEKLKVLKMKGMDFKIESWKHIAILSFYAPITAAFCEEFFYRGFAITTLGSLLGNFWIAGIISCFAFAFLHLPYFKLGGVVQIGVWGLFPMILFIITGSIYPGLIMHFLNNIFAYILRPLFLMNPAPSKMYFGITQKTN